MQLQERTEVQKAPPLLVLQEVVRLHLFLRWTLITAGQRDDHTALKRFRISLAKPIHPH